MIIHCKSIQFCAFQEIDIFLPGSPVSPLLPETPGAPVGPGTPGVPPGPTSPLLPGGPVAPSSPYKVLFVRSENGVDQYYTYFYSRFP